MEREQILLACEKEIEQERNILSYHQIIISLSCLTFLNVQERNIAIELEQKMMEDFEWKLREVEGGYKTKIKTLEEGLESKVKFYIKSFGKPQAFYSSV